MPSGTTSLATYTFAATTVLDLSDPRPENHMIYTAVAPKAVFTMRTLTTRATPAPEFSAQIPPAQTAK